MVMKDVSNIQSHHQNYAGRDAANNGNRRKPTVSFSDYQETITNHNDVKDRSPASSDKTIDSTNFHFKVQQIEEKKGQTEEALTSLRGKLEEYRRLSHLKRQRLNEKRGSELLENLTKDLPGYQNGERVDDDMLRQLLEKESKELESRIQSLESQKGEMEQTILELFGKYQGKNTVLKQEKKRLEDDKDTTYAEMKNLLIEQHEESERLRMKVSKLQKKRRRIASAARTAVGMLSFAMVGVAIWLNFFVEDVPALFGGLNYLCAPARPGTQVNAASGPMSAPWWAPRYTKELIFPMVCSTRPRIYMEIKRGIIHIAELPSGTIVAKKMGNTAYIETERLHISDSGGGHKEMVAPWVAPDDRGRKM